MKLQEPTADVDFGRTQSVKLDILPQTRQFLIKENNQLKSLAMNESKRVEDLEKQVQQKKKEIKYLSETSLDLCRKWLEKPKIIIDMNKVKREMAEYKKSYKTQKEKYEKFKEQKEKQIPIFQAKKKQTSKKQNEFQKEKQHIFQQIQKQFVKIQTIQNEAKQIITSGKDRQNGGKQGWKFLQRLRDKQLGTLDLQL